ncbi:MAG: hypothetical protein ACP5JE_05275 [Thermoplasmata archaeon]
MRKVIISKNRIERFNKEIRIIIKIIDFLPGKESPRKVIYLRTLRRIINTVGIYSWIQYM